jgi:hypothetical protein
MGLRRASPRSCLLHPPSPHLIINATQDVSGAMQPRQAAYFSVHHLNPLRVGRAAINATFAALQRRLLSMDPYLPVDTQVGACVASRAGWAAVGVGERLSSNKQRPARHKLSTLRCAALRCATHAGDPLARGVAHGLCRRPR